VAEPRSWQGQGHEITWKDLDVPPIQQTFPLIPKVTKYGRMRPIAACWVFDYPGGQIKSVN
jgi:hypothetical protein